MLARFDLRSDDAALERAVAGNGAPDGVRDAVAAIIADVRARGDEALLDYTERFDRVRLDSVTLDPTELERARADVAPDLLDALAVAHDQILSYHERTTAAATEAAQQRQKVADDRARMESLIGDYFKEHDKYQDARRRLADHFGVKPGQVNIDCHNTNVTVNIGLDEIVAILGQ